MNVTEVPVQMEVLLALIEMDGVRIELTVIVTEFEVAVEVLAHDALLVITHVTTSLFANVVEV